MTTPTPAQVAQAQELHRLTDPESYKWVHGGRNDGECYRCSLFLAALATAHAEGRQAREADVRKIMDDAALLSGSVAEMERDFPQSWEGAGVIGRMLLTNAKALADDVLRRLATEARSRS